MDRSIVLLKLGIVLLMFFIFDISFAQNSIAIVPFPNKLDMVEGEMSEINKINIYLSPTQINTYLKVLIDKTNNFHRVENPSEANMFLYHDEKIGTESYILEVEKEVINLKYGDHAGMQYGLMSLAQMISHSGLPMPMLKIEDAPKFKYRGMHLDVSRHFFEVDEVKKYLDFMAYYKFNHFHWHLTDDQGWRIQINKYPKLQEVAAFRIETLIGHYSDQPHKFDGKKYGGFYTQNQVKEIVAYAAHRNIQVIPEIEMPGHALAALAAYPELGCNGEKYEVATKWGVFEDVFCPYEATFRFLQDVIDEILPLFPGKYIHIGGDECPKESWKKSPFCQDLIKSLNLKDEHGLQSYFITRMEKYINSKGKQIIGWDEILEGGLAPNATVMSWRGIQGGLDAARQNHEVIMTPGSHCYFDHYQSESPNEPVAIGGYTTVEKVYEWEPIPKELEAEKRKYILGGQANVWTEYITTFGHVEYMAFARGIAMSEALWSVNKNYEDFMYRYEIHNQHWKNLGANIAYHVLELKPQIFAGVGDNVQIGFTVPGNINIQYTIDRKNQGTLSNNEKLPLIQSGKYFFKAVKGDKEGNELELIFDKHLGTSSKISLENQPNEPYKGNGPGSLVNGVLGSNLKYGGTEWLGFNGKDCVGVLDFVENVPINDISFRFFKGQGQWIYLPKKVEIFGSLDGIKYTLITSNENISTKSKVANINLNVGGKYQYIKFKIHNYGKIPAGKQGAGHAAWLFVDEIVVR